MKSLNTLLILATAFLAVFAQAAFDFTRQLLGAQLDLLPPLMVYTSLTGNLTAVTLLAAAGGLWLDSLSANPLGVTVLPLFIVGFALHHLRELILREQITAQFVLGLMAGATVPLMTVLLLLSAGHNPLLGWGSLWQLLVVSVGGGILTPITFRYFNLLNRLLNYRPATETSFRPDREIRRGRS